MDFLEIRHHGKQKNTPLQCRGILGGPLLETLYVYDFSKKPFIDVRFCQRCRRWVKIVIKNINELPEQETFDQGIQINFKREFPLTVVRCGG